MTRGQHIATMLGFKGGLLAIAAAGAFGIGQGRAALVVGAAWASAFFALPFGLGFAGPIVLLVSALFIASAQTLPGFRGPTLWAARVLAALVTAFLLLQVLGAVFSRIPVFIVSTLIQLAIPALMIWAAWFTRGGRAERLSPTGPGLLPRP